MTKENTNLEEEKEEVTLLHYHASGSRVQVSLTPCDSRGLRLVIQLPLIFSPRVVRVTLAHLQPLVPPSPPFCVSVRGASMEIVN